MLSRKVKFSSILVAIKQDDDEEVGQKAEDGSGIIPVCLFSFHLLDRRDVPRDMETPKMLRNVKMMMVL